jgi:hypothetical protein
MQSLDDYAKSDLDKLEKLANNFEWIHKQYDNLQEKYENNSVAVRDRKIVDKDSNLNKLLETGHNKL